MLLDSLKIENRELLAFSVNQHNESTRTHIRSSKTQMSNNLWIFWNL